MRGIAEDHRLMPHFHLSIQSGDDLILKRMKRRHLSRDVVAFCEEVRRLRPEVAFGADLIAGFPTETETMFENTLKLVDDAGLSFLHVFPFSARRGTAAARMPQVNREAVRARAAALRSKGAVQLRNRLKSLVGTEQSLLVETAGRGRTGCFAPARFVAPVEAGSCVRARVSNAEPDHLHVELLL
jgi:threonylcarbamoyladenosine tRNA methylthiotransferase MtaB